MRNPKNLLLILFLAFALTAQGAVVPSTNKMVNAEFELGNMSYWFKDGPGIAAVESCCGQHNTFFYPSPHYDNYLCSYSPLCGKARDKWDGYIQPQGGWAALAQGVSGLAGNKSYRLSSWVSTSGMIAYIRWYAGIGGTRSCASTSVVYPTYSKLSCLLTTPANTGGFNAHVTGSASPGIWALTDDWALTEQVTPGILPGSRWTLPIRYWARDYPSSTDTAVSDWNLLVGKTLFVKAANEAAAQLIIDGVDGWEDNLLAGATGPISGGKQYLEVNNWYFGQWGTTAKVSTLSHELGHVLGLQHVNGCQIMQGGPWTRTWYCGLSLPTPADVNGVKVIYP